MRRDWKLTCNAAKPKWTAGTLRAPTGDEPSGSRAAFSPSNGGSRLRHDVVQHAQPHDPPWRGAHPLDSARTQAPN